MWILLCVFGAGFLILAALALRDRTSFRMAVRNVPRRRAQTALIVVGLMLATLLFSAAFTTGDTLTNSLRVQALENIGRVDVVVKAEQPESGGGAAFGPGAGGPAAPASRERYFDEDLAGKVRDRLAGENVAGVAPLARETAPVTSPKTDLSEPRVDVLGMDAASTENFDGLTTASGKVLALGELGTDEVYVSRETAEGLGVGKGDKVETALLLRSEQPVGEQRPSGSRNGPPPGIPQVRATEAAREQSPPELTIAGIYENGANPASDASMVMPLEELQKLVGEEGRVNEILVTHGGPAVEGGEHTGSTVSAIGPLLADNGLEVDPVKKDAIEEADDSGATFSTLFVLFGQFSVAAGMLLIFQIFPESLYVQGVDKDYSESIGYGFETTAKGYGSAREVWKALQTEEDTVVISSDLAPSRNVSTFGPAVEPSVKLTGFYREDENLPDELHLRVQNPDSGKMRDLRVIGVLESSAYFTGDIVTSQGTLDSLAGRTVSPQTYYFGLGSGTDAAATATTLQKVFARNGLQTQVTAQMIRDNDAQDRLSPAARVYEPRARGRHRRIRCHSSALGCREAPADRDDEGLGLPERAGVAGLPARIFLRRPARHRRGGGTGPGVLQHAHRQHQPEHPGSGVPGAVGRAVARDRGRLRRRAPDDLPASPPGVESLPGRGPALRVARR
jgi:MacB-like periplasmic core domain